MERIISAIILTSMVHCIWTVCGYARKRKLSNVSVKSASWHWCNGRGEFIWRLTLVADNLGYVRSILMPPRLVNDNVLEGAEV